MYFIQIIAFLTCNNPMRDYCYHNFTKQVIFVLTYPSRHNALTQCSALRIGRWSIKSTRFINRVGRPFPVHASPTKGCLPFPAGDRSHQIQIQPNDLIQLSAMARRGLCLIQPVILISQQSPQYCICRILHWNKFPFI